MLKYFLFLLFVSVVLSNAIEQRSFGGNERYVKVHESERTMVKVPVAEVTTPSTNTSSIIHYTNNKEPHLPTADGKPVHVLHVLEMPPRPSLILMIVTASTTVKRTTAVLDVKVNENYTHENKNVSEPQKASSISNVAKTSSPSPNAVNSTEKSFTVDAVTKKANVNEVEITLPNSNMSSTIMKPTDITSDAKITEKSVTKTITDDKPTEVIQVVHETTSMPIIVVTETSLGPTVASHSTGKPVSFEISKTMAGAQEFISPTPIITDILTSTAKPSVAALIDSTTTENSVSMTKTTASKTNNKISEVKITTLIPVTNKSSTLAAKVGVPITEKPTDEIEVNKTTSPTVVTISPVRINLELSTTLKPIMIPASVEPTTAKPAATIVEAVTNNTTTVADSLTSSVSTTTQTSHHDDASTVATESPKEKLIKIETNKSSTSGKEVTTTAPINALLSTTVKSVVVTAVESTKPVFEKSVVIVEAKNSVIQPSISTFNFETSTANNNVVSDNSTEKSRTPMMTTEATVKSTSVPPLKISATTVPFVNSTVEKTSVEAINQTTAIVAEMPSLMPTVSPAQIARIRRQAPSGSSIHANATGILHRPAMTLNTTKKPTSSPISGNRSPETTTKLPSPTTTAMRNARQSVMTTIRPRTTVRISTTTNRNRPTPPTRHPIRTMHPSVRPSLAPTTLRSSATTIKPTTKPAVVTSKPVTTGSVTQLPKQG